MFTTQLGMRNNSNNKKTNEFRGEMQEFKKVEAYTVLVESTISS